MPPLISILWGGGSELSVSGLLCNAVLSCFAPEETAILLAMNFYWCLFRYLYMLAS